MATIEINVLDASIEIKEVHKDRQITLSKEAWQSLCACKSQLDQALQEGAEIQFDLDDKVKATTNNFNDKTYLHIRSWWNGHPTKQGISLREQDWGQLDGHLKQGDDMTLGIEVLRRMLKRKVGDYMRLECEGCVKDWPSQRDHECLMNTQQFAAQALEKVVNNLDPTQFISAWAVEANKRKLVLDSRPMQLFKKLLVFHLEAIKKDILKSY